MTDELILALDQGTTSSRAALVARDGRRIAEAQRATAQHHPAPGSSSTTRRRSSRRSARCARDVLAERRRVTRCRSRHHEPTRDDRPLGSRHRRTAPSGAGLAGHANRSGLRGPRRVRRRRPGARTTGLPIQPYFSATKLAWLLDEIPDARRRAEAGELAAGTIESWLAWSLTGGTAAGAHVTDVTNASRTMLLDTQASTGTTSCSSSSPSRARSCPASSRRGRARRSAARARTARSGIELPLLALLGDQQAALLGQACLTTGSAKCTFGTGAFLLVNAGTARPDPGAELLAGPAYQAAGRRRLLPGRRRRGRRKRGSLAGRRARVARRPRPSPTRSRPRYRTAPEFASSRPSRGSTRPGGTPPARGSISGLTLHTTRAHLVRATLEAIAFQTRAIVEAAEDAARRARSRCCGSTAARPRTALSSRPSPTPSDDPSSAPTTPRQPSAGWHLQRGWRRAMGRRGRARRSARADRARRAGLVERPPRDPSTPTGSAPSSEAGAGPV